MRSMFRLVFLLLLLPAVVAGQGTAIKPAVLKDNAKDAPEPFVFKPTIGLGTGMFSFYGDVYRKNLASFQTARIGYDLSIHQTLTPYLNIGFYTMFGKLGANERLIYRNVNFESQIRV